MVLAIAVCTSLVTMLILNLLRSVLTFGRRRIRERLKLILAHSADVSFLRAPSDIEKREDRSVPSADVRRSKTALKQRKIRFLSISMPSSFLGRRYMEKLRSNLIKAGIPLKPEEMVGFAFVSGLLGLAAGILFLHKVFAGLLLGISGSFLPALWLAVAKKKRSSQIEGQLLNALVLIANSLRAGHSFMQALELVSRELTPPLSLEFSKVLRESKMGIPVEEALMNMVKRVESKDLELAVTAVLIQRQVGGNLARVLDNISVTIDKRIKMRARIRVVTAQGRISAWIISVLPFALGALVFGMYPDFGRIMLVNPLGVGMLSGAFALLVIGILVIRQVVNIDV